jgi:hypothetical protein
MTKQQLAKRRNWSKARLMGITFDEQVFTEDEICKIKVIRNYIKVLLNEWDDESRKLDLNPLPYYEIVDKTDGRVIDVTKDKKRWSKHNEDVIIRPI